MNKIEDCRRRLTALTAEGVESLAACRSLQDRLRELKREVLAELLDLRTQARERARKSLGLEKTSPREQARRAPGSESAPRKLWQRPDVGAKKLLEDVRERVTGILDDKSADAVEAWAAINQEIDARLSRLAELEHQLARAAGEGAAVPSEPAGHDDDDLYAAVGAAVKKGAPRGAFCSHCGQGVGSDDRFCRHCGHRLR